MEMQYDDHFPITRLEYGMLDVVVQDVHFITTHRCETEPCEQADMLKCDARHTTMHVQVSIKQKTPSLYRGSFISDRWNKPKENESL